MTDRPILFSSAMVRALLDGRKTQTRRVAKVKRGVTIADISEWVGEEGSMARRGVFQRHQIAEPRFAVGDTLWVREAWRTGGQHDHIAPRDLPQEWAGPIGYIADEAPNTISRTGRFRQGMHMPRWASRLTLTVTDVRVQRLQEISEADAIAEGVTRIGAEYIAKGATEWDDGPNFYTVAVDGCNFNAPTAAGAYQLLWDHLNEKRAPWSSNPFVVAVSFTVERRNIDEVAP